MERRHWIQSLPLCDFGHAILAEGANHQTIDVRYQCKMFTTLSFHSYAESYHMINARAYRNDKCRCLKRCIRGKFHPLLCDRMGQLQIPRMETKSIIAFPIDIIPYNWTVKTLAVCSVNSELMSPPLCFCYSYKCKAETTVR